MFADMRGFMRISEQMAPDEAFPLLDEHFELLTRITLAHGGRVFHVAGDEPMAGFGVPDPRDDATCRALEAAREMLARFGAWPRRPHRARHRPGLNCIELPALQLRRREAPVDAYWLPAGLPAASRVEV